MSIVTFVFAKISYPGVVETTSDGWVSKICCMSWNVVEYPGSSHSRVISVLFRCASRIRTHVVIRDDTVLQRITGIWVAK